MKTIIGILIFAIFSSTITGQPAEFDNHPLDIIILIDCSPSTRETDPENLRVKAARFLLDYLRGISKMTQVTYRAGLAAFGGKLGATVALMSLADNLPEIFVIGDEKIPYTDFRPPLEFAVSELQKHGSNQAESRQIVILFTDGSLQLTDRALTPSEKQGYFLRDSLSSPQNSSFVGCLVQQLHTAGAELFVVTVGAQEQDAALWQKLIPKDHYFSINSTTSLLALYHDLGLNFTRMEKLPEQTVSQNHPLEFELSPYLEQVIFTCIKTDPNTRIKLIDPTGEIKKPTSGGGAKSYYKIYAIPEPDWHGNWKMSVKGDSVQVWVDQRLPSILVKLPQRDLFINDSIKISAFLACGKDTVKNSTLQVRMNCTLPGTEKAWKINFKSDSQGEFTTWLPRLKKIGIYTLTPTAFVNQLQVQTKYSIKNFYVAKHSYPWVYFISLMLIISIVAFILFKRIKNKYEREKSDLKQQVGDLKQQAEDNKEFSLTEKIAKLVDQAVESANSDKDEEAKKYFYEAIAEIDEYQKFVKSSISFNLESAFTRVFSTDLFNPEEQKKIYLDLVTEDISPAIVNGLAKWIIKQEHDKFGIADFYRLLEKPGVLKVIETIGDLDEPFDSENKSKYQENFIAQFSKLYYSLYQASFAGINDTTTKEIKKIAEFLQATEESDKQVLAAVFNFINQLSGQKPFDEIDFKPIEQKFGQLPDSIRELIQQAKEGFQWGSFSEMEESLTGFIEQNKNKYSHFVEFKLLEAIARTWWERVKTLVEHNYKPATVAIELSPSLELDIDKSEEKEELDKKGNKYSRYIELPVAVTNMGKFPITDVKLAFKRHAGYRRTDSDSDYLFADHSQRLKSGETVIKRIRLVQTDKTQIQVKVSFKDFLQGYKITDESLQKMKSEGLSENSAALLDQSKIKNEYFKTEQNFKDILEKTIGRDTLLNYENIILENSQCIPGRIFSRKKLKSEIFYFLFSTPKEMNNVKNPYIPDSPLITQWERNHLMLGNHKQIIEEIYEDIITRKGRIYIVRGLKRTGKTTVLHGIENQMIQNGLYLSIFIDFYQWYLKLVNRKKRANTEMILYEIAIRIYDQAYLKKLRIKQIEKYLLNYKDTLKMSEHEFSLFIALFHKNCRTPLNLLFFIDEVDWWNRESKEMQKVIHRLIYYMKSNASEFRASTIMTVEWNNEQWENNFKELIPPKNIALLNYEQIENLSQKSRLSYSPLALELIWRVTGGWEGIVQLVFHRIIDTIKKKHHSITMIDISLAKRVINEMITSEQDREFIRYFIKSIDIKEIKFLKLINEIQLIDKKTSRLKSIKKIPEFGFIIDDENLREKFKGIDFNKTLQNLESKSIIEPISATLQDYRLRVGLFVYQGVLNLGMEKLEEKNAS